MQVELLVILNGLHVVWDDYFRKIICETKLLIMSYILLTNGHPPWHTHGAIINTIKLLVVQP